MITRTCDKCKVQIKMGNEQRRLYINEDNNPIWLDLCYMCEKQFKDIVKEFLNEKPQSYTS